MATISLSALQSFTAAYQSQPFWIGVDVHKRSYHVALHRADDKTITFTTTASPDAFIKQIQRLNIPVAGVAYEAGPTGFSLARQLLAQGYPIEVIAPGKTPQPANQGSKSDRLDCVQLAEYGQKGMLKAVCIPTEQEEADRLLCRMRDQVIKKLAMAARRPLGSSPL